ncbi:phosphoribosylformylglycinamidine synthase, partial [gut metagenome]
AGRILSAYALDRQGIVAAVSKMAFGNQRGVKINHNVDERNLFAAGFGDIICEVRNGKVGELAITYTEIGEVLEESVFQYKDMTISMAEALETWKEPLEKVFKTRSGSETDDATKNVDHGVYDTKDVHICSHKIAQPTVFIPVFPGTNCEYDSTKAFERAGAKVITKVFKNLDAADIRDS